VWRPSEEDLKTGLRRVEAYVEALSHHVKGRTREVLLKLRRELTEVIEGGPRSGANPPGLGSGRRVRKGRLGGRSSEEYCIDSGVKGALDKILEEFFGEACGSIRPAVVSA